jgi:putative sterol carrier protein
MPSLLTAEWLALQQEETASLPERSGCTARIQYEVSGPPDGTIVFHTHLEDGRIVRNALGADEDADFTMLVPRQDFEAIVRGELDPTVGYMQGRIKVTGNIGRMLSVLPATTSPEWCDAMARVAAETDAA